MRLLSKFQFWQVISVTNEIDVYRSVRIGSRPSLRGETSFSPGAFSFMTSNSDDLLAKAAACEEQAEHMRDPQVRALFVGVARQWRDVAKQLREGERPDVSKAESRLTRRSG